MYDCGVEYEEENQFEEDMEYCVDCFFSVFVVLWVDFGQFEWCLVEVGWLFFVVFEGFFQQLCFIFELICGLLFVF